MVAENARPLIARLDRCIDGPHRQALLAAQAAARARVGTAREARPDMAARTAEALHLARKLELHPSGSPLAQHSDGGQ